MEVLYTDAINTVDGCSPIHFDPTNKTKKERKTKQNIIFLLLHL